jgi:phosphatidylinositol alpha-1,6-mannosyltransferase
MRTLLITLEYPPFFGGVANYYGNLVANWPDKDGVVVLGNSEKKLVDERRRYVKWLPAILSVRKLFKANGFDHLLVGQLLPLGIVAYYLQKLYKFDYSVIIHGMDFTYALKTERKKKMTHKILAKSRRIICTNSYTSKLVIDFLGKESESKVFVVNPGVDAKALEPRDEARIVALKSQYGITTEFVLLSMARLVKRKGVDQVILALARLSDRWPNLVYLVAGKGPDEEHLRTYAESLGNNFSNVIKFIGSPNDHDKWQLLHLADAYAMVSREENGDFEGFGITYLEAGLAGKPVIAGASGGVADAVENEVNGLMVAPTDSAEIAAAIELLMDRPDLGKRLGQAGRERALRQFKWQDQAQKFYNVLN